MPRSASAVHRSGKKAAGCKPNEQVVPRTLVGMETLFHMLPLFFPPPSRALREKGQIPH